MATDRSESDVVSEGDTSPNVPAGSTEPATIPSFPGRVVGIGASAGGLDALDAIFEAMPLDSGCAFVIVQHLSRDFDSHMASLLRRKTRLEVDTAEHDQVIEPNRIYLIPKGKLLTIGGGRLIVSDLDPKIIPPMPISVFLRSLAQDRGERAIAVILSGGGSDGTEGAVAVHNAGGRVIVQDPKSAAFDSMPQSVINTGVFDLILKPFQMAEAIVDQNDDMPGDETPAVCEKAATAVERIMQLLKEAYAVDFSAYKPNTIIRRIERRIQIDNLASIDAYAERLESNVDELERLYEDLLIGVTQFFRDPLQFACIETTVVPDLIKLGKAHGEIRVWVAGCASGEEAYSIAMLLERATHELDTAIKIRIFATDIHGASLHRAIAGVYSQDAVADISSERLTRYFTVDKNGYRIAPVLKDMVLFTRHNLIQDPPFTNMNLVTCRNLLIYLDNETQERAIARLHFALRENGYLFLGASERTNRYKEEFEAIGSQVQIFRKKRDVRLIEAVAASKTPLPVSLGQRRGPPVESQRGMTPALASAYNCLLDKVVHRGFLVDMDGAIHHTFGDAGRYIQLSGSMQTNLMTLVDEQLKPAIHTTLLRVRRSEDTERSGFVQVEVGGREERLRIEAQAMPPDQNGRRMYLVLFSPETTMPVSVDTLAEDDSDESGVTEVAWLRQELLIARQSLENLMQEVGTRNEELQAANEELTAANEELQSTNEELQSVNEELYTINNEYQRKIGELQATTDDLNNLIRSTEIGVIFTDSDLNIRRFTPKATEFLSLIDSDIGRPLADVNPKLRVSDLAALAGRILNEGTVHEEEVKGKDGRWYLMRVLPYRGKTNVIGGVILAFVDIHHQKTAELATRIAEERYDLAIRQAGLGIWDWNLVTDELFWSEAFLKMVQVDPDAFGGTIDDFRKRVHPADAERVSKAIEAQLNEGQPYDIELRMMLGDGADTRIRSCGAVIRSDDGQPLRFVGFAEDIGQRQRQERALRYEQMSLMVHSIDADRRLIDVNPFWLRRMGYRRDEVIGRCADDFMTDASRKKAAEATSPNSAEAGAHTELPLQFVTKSGDVLDVLLSQTDVRDKEGKSIANLASLVETTDLKRQQHAQLDLLESIDDLPLGIGIFDADNRLVRWNRAYGELYAAIRDRLVVGATFTALLEATARAGIFDDEISLDEIDARLQGECWSTERRLKDGTRVRVLDHRMIDGSLAAFRYRIGE